MFALGALLKRQDKSRLSTESSSLISSSKVAFLETGKLKRATMKVTLGAPNANATLLHPLKCYRFIIDIGEILVAFRYRIMKYT